MGTYLDRPAPRTGLAAPDAAQSRRPAGCPEGQSLPQRAEHESPPVRRGRGCGRQLFGVTPDPTSEREIDVHVDLNNTDLSGSASTNISEGATSERNAAGSERTRVLCDVHGLLDEPCSPLAGIVWKLTETGRQLDANLASLGPD